MSRASLLSWAIVTLALAGVHEFIVLYSRGG